MSRITLATTSWYLRPRRQKEGRLEGQANRLTRSRLREKEQLTFRCWECSPQVCGCSTPRFVRPSPRSL